MPRKSLTLHDLAAIACAPPDARAAELAHELGQLRYLVGQALVRIRRAGGWYSRLKLVPCRVCGLPVAGPGRRLLHRSCGPSWREGVRAQRPPRPWTRERALTRGDIGPAAPARPREAVKRPTAAERRAEVVAAMPAHLARRLGLVPAP